MPEKNGGWLLDDSSLEKGLYKSDNEEIYITINHLDEFNGLSNIKVGDTLTLIKDLDNPYDDEAIAVFDKDNIKVGYVANSVDTVARGTHSAGRVYENIHSQDTCVVNYITQDNIIASLNIQLNIRTQSRVIEYKKYNERRKKFNYGCIKSIVNNLENGELTLVASRPCMGKTSFLINLFLMTLSLNKNKALFFSLENDVVKFNNRVFSIKMRKRIQEDIELSEKDLQEISKIENELNSLNYYVNDDPCLSTRDIDRIIEEIQKESEISAVFIDYYQLLDYKSETKLKIGSELKQIAVNRNVPIIVSSQLGRNIERRYDKRPLLKDLKERGLYINDFDNIIFLYRDRDDYDEKYDRENIDILVAKSSLGLIGHYEMAFDCDTGQFYAIRMINGTEYENGYMNTNSYYDPELDEDEDYLKDIMEELYYYLDDVDVLAKNEKNNELVGKLITKLMRIIN